jgi:uncharacterized membrane protein YpjA
MLKLFENKKFLLFLIIINIIASIIALFYYQNQLLSSEIIFWIFIADCPIFAAAFALALYKKLNKKESNFLTFFAISGVLKYSLWTILVLIISTNILNYLLILIAHILFLLEVIVFYKKNIFKLKHVILTLIIFLISDFVDYIYLTHPPINQNFFTEIMIISIFLSFFSVFIISLFFSKK